jgi:outer membrane protein
MDVYRQTLENDPIFKAEYNNFMSKSELLPQARSALLPQLAANGQYSRNELHVVAGGFDDRQLYSRRTWGLTASQEIFNYQSWAQVKQAKATVKAAHATFNNKAQDLIVRTAKAYFDVLFAQDTLDFVQAKLRANKRQLDQAQERFNVGLDAITSVYEAKAAHDQSVAEVISAKNNQINQNENLRKITNHTYENLSSLRNSRVPLISPEPNNVNDWIATGLKQNYNLLAAKYNMQASQDNVKAQNSGNWPTLSLQGSHNSTTNSGGDSNFFVPSLQEISTVAVSMNLPFYQGGLVRSQTRQAQYDFQASSEQLEQTYRDVEVNSKIAFNTIIDGISKVKADRQTIISQKNSLESTEAQFQVGTRTMVDVVNAQQRLFEAQQQLARDQYNFINAILNLKLLAGTLNVDDLGQINSWLNTTHINSLPPSQKISAKKNAKQTK